MDFFCSLRVPIGAAMLQAPGRVGTGAPSGLDRWLLTAFELVECLVFSPVSIVVSPASGWLAAQVSGIWAAISFSATDGPRPLAQDPSRCCMPPIASGRELLVGAAAPRSSVSQCAHSLRCKFRLGFSGLQAPLRIDHAAAPHLSPNVTLWVDASSLHQFGVSDCRDRVLGSKSLVISAKRARFPMQPPSWFSGAPGFDRIFFFLSCSRMPPLLRVLYRGPLMLGSSLMRFTGLVDG
ncbi:hypothetical protein NDU88_003661 [Pleurodeles waltl]|uniref:Uncharacterized protein n=1 Tax=Pleurodeles waltl TaxID=8319 RepID=A0AAV7LJ77_PLEWA|nr:hypothetical protein NDU88_003661 [Pleurodeles waltl]